MYEIIKVKNYCILLNPLAGSETCKVEAFVGDGFINERRETSGLSHLVEHVLTEAWKGCLKGGSTVFWKKYGVTMSAETNNNTIRYYIEGLAEYVFKMIAYICSLVTNPSLILNSQIMKNRVKKEKQAIINELLKLDEESTRLLDGANQAIYKNEGLRFFHDRDLQLQNLERFDLKSIFNWVETKYCVNNTLFIISGAFNKTKVIAQLKKNIE